MEHLDLRSMLPATKWVDRCTWRLGGDWFGRIVARSLSSRISGSNFDLGYIEGGEWVTPAVIRVLRRSCMRIVSYNIDDPFGMRDRARFRAYRSCLPYYDLCVVVREQNVGEARALGARAVLRVFMSADEVTHAPRMLTSADHARWDSQVLFLGTWFPERGPLLRELIELRVPLTIRGSEWHKAPEWPRLEGHWKGGEIRGDDYAKAIQCARVCIGLVSKGNRDLHTTRSLEIPALGSLLCAQRTKEHLAMYEEGREALFWNEAEECAAMCRIALNDEERRKSMAKSGQARVRSNGHYNESVMQKILSAALLIAPNSIHA